MLTAITDAFLSVLNPVSIGAILLGVPIGMIIGAIPGLGGTIGMTIFIPFTFTMPTAVAIPFLLAIYRSTTYGGSVSAILLRIPGTPEAAATLNENRIWNSYHNRSFGWLLFFTIQDRIFICYHTHPGHTDVLLWDAKLDKNYTSGSYSPFTSLFSSRKNNVNPTTNRNTPNVSIES